jgi:hypothetical protein
MSFFDLPFERTVKTMAETKVEATSGGAKDLLLALVNLNTQIKNKRGEMKKLRDDYKSMSEKVREVMQQHEWDNIEANGCNIMLYEKRLTQKLDEDFAAETLQAFFAERKLQVPTNVGAEAAEYLFSTKKEADAGSSWTLTIRQKKKKKASTGKRKAAPKKKGVKRKQPEDDDSAIPVSEEPPAKSARVEPVQL